MFVVCDAAEPGGPLIPVVMEMLVNIGSSLAKLVKFAERQTFSSSSLTAGWAGVELATGFRVAKVGEALLLTISAFLTWWDVEGSGEDPVG
jgi:hypothetical protein